MRRNFVIVIIFLILLQNFYEWCYLLCWTKNKIKTYTNMRIGKNADKSGGATIYWWIYSITYVECLQNTWDIDLVILSVQMDNNVHGNYMVSNAKHLLLYYSVAIYKNFIFKMLISILIAISDKIWLWLRGKKKWTSNL